MNQGENFCGFIGPVVTSSAILVSSFIQIGEGQSCKKVVEMIWNITCIRNS